VWREPHGSSGGEYLLLELSVTTSKYRRFLGEYKRQKKRLKAKFSKAS
jgi:hypothetical protein